MKLSRIDRAAMQLAYEELRCNVSIGPSRDWRIGAAWSAYDDASRVLRSIGMHVPLRIGVSAPDEDVRILRVRLALLLRVLLRASAGDYGQSRYPYERSGPLYPRYRPLW